MQKSDFSVNSSCHFVSFAFGQRPVRTGGNIRADEVLGSYGLQFVQGDGLDNPIVQNFLGVGHQPDPDAVPLVCPGT